MDDIQWLLLVCGTPHTFSRCFSPATLPITNGLDLDTDPDIAAHAHRHPAFCILIALLNLTLDLLCQTSNYSHILIFILAEINDEPRAICILICSKPWIFFVKKQTSLKILCVYLRAVYNLISFQIFYWLLCEYCARQRVKERREVCPLCSIIEQFNYPP